MSPSGSGVDRIRVPELTPPAAQAVKNNTNTNDDDGGRRVFQVGAVAEWERLRDDMETASAAFDGEEGEEAGAGALYFEEGLLQVEEAEAAETEEAETGKHGGGSKLDSSRFQIGSSRTAAAAGRRGYEGYRRGEEQLLESKRHSATRARARTPAVAVHGEEETAVAAGGRRQMGTGKAATWPPAHTPSAAASYLSSSRAAAVEHIPGEHLGYQARATQPSVPLSPVARTRSFIDTGSPAASFRSSGASDGGSDGGLTLTSRTVEAGGGEETSVMGGRGGTGGGTSIYVSRRGSVTINRTIKDSHI